MSICILGKRLQLVDHHESRKMRSGERAGGKIERKEENMYVCVVVLAVHGGRHLRTLIVAQ